MKVYVYHNAIFNQVYCYNELSALKVDDEILIQIIEAEETSLPITENWKTLGIEVGEVFRCNDNNENLIRTA